MSRQRKILQIAASSDEMSASVFALCEEGRIWCKMFNSEEYPWREIDPLPPIEDVATCPVYKQRNNGKLQYKLVASVSGKPRSSLL